MTKARLLLPILLIPVLSALRAQPFSSWTGTGLKLNNGIVQRTLELPAVRGHFITTAYQPVQGDFNYFRPENTDFQFEADHLVYSGRSNWFLKNIVHDSDAYQGDGAAVTLVSKDKKIELTIRFLLYPGSPVIRKNLLIKNLSGHTILLESVDVEKFEVTDYGTTTFSWICHDYGRRRSIGPYDGNLQDALVTVHNSDWQQGILIGNEAAGVVKHTSVFWNEAAICAGLTHKDSRYPFRKYITAGASFATPQVFTLVYNQHKDPDEVLNGPLPDFIREHMGIRLSTLPQKPTFVYNTWVPFSKDISEKLVMELAKAAAEAGMKEFIIDDGWMENYGDWVIDKRKFPRGLKPVFEYIKSLGMKPGLWISIGSASTGSRVFRSHPEWFVQDEHKRPVNLHVDDPSMRTACFGTGWYNYIREILLKLTLEYGLEYLKLDFTVVTSPYRFDNRISGCYAQNHSGHRDHNESLYTNYEQVWRLFDELHTAKKGLFIDCTFETMGGLQLIDYAMLKHAEGNWLSNFNGPEAKVDLRIRNMAWWRSPAIPSTALVIGNPEMQDTAWSLHIQSAAGALPIMLGDPRKLSVADLKKYRSYADWLQKMDNNYQVMGFRQDLPGFGEPMEGFWDGFQRINSATKKGGLLGIFRQGSPESKRRVTIQFLDPDKTYQVLRMDGSILTTQTGHELLVRGFDVELEKRYDGELFEISSQ